jgi:hypothetical protein
VRRRRRFQHRRRTSSRLLSLRLKSNLTAGFQVFSYGGFAGSLDHLARERYGHVPTNPELDQLSRELAAEGILPGDQWWLSEEGTHAAMAPSITDPCCPLSAFCASRVKLNARPGRGSYYCLANSASRTRTSPKAAASRAGTPIQTFEHDFAMVRLLKPESMLIALLGLRYHPPPWGWGPKLIKRLPIGCQHPFLTGRLQRGSPANRLR